MQPTAQIHKNDIGRFQRLKDVRTYKKIKEVQEKVDELRDIFQAQDNSPDDFNKDPSTVLLDGFYIGKRSFENHRASGVLSYGEPNNTTFEAETTNRVTMVLTGYGTATLQTDKEFFFQETNAESRWVLNSTSSGPSERDNKQTRVEVRENKSTGVISLFD